MIDEAVFKKNLHGGSAELFLAVDAVTKMKNLQTENIASS